MKKNRMFLRCSICGNLVNMIEDSGATPICCGQEMNLLVANTTDGAHEKHVPVAVRTGNEIRVTVGEVPHPMIEAHHIAWIAITDGIHTQRIMLDHTGAPEAVFPVKDDEPVEVYEYCNLHGLWMSVIE